MNLKKLLMLLSVALIAISANATWYDYIYKTEEPYEGELNFSEDGTPISFVLTGINQPNTDNLIIPQYVTFDKYEWEQIIATISVPIIGIKNFSANVSSITIDADLEFIHDMETNATSVTINGKIKEITNSFNKTAGNQRFEFSEIEVIENCFKAPATSLTAIFKGKINRMASTMVSSDIYDNINLKKVVLNEVEDMENCFAGCSFSELSFDAINKITSSFNNVPVTQQILEKIIDLEYSFDWSNVSGIFNLPSNIRSLTTNASISCSLLCNKNLEYLGAFFDDNGKVLIYPGTQFEITVDEKSEIYYGGTKEQFENDILKSKFHEDWGWWYGINSISFSGYDNEFKIYTGASILPDNTLSGDLYTEFSCPDDVSVIPANFLRDYTFLEKVNIDYVDKIERYAFYRCIGLKEIKINAKEIAEHAFASDPYYDSYHKSMKIENLTLGNKLKKIHGWAFNRSMITNLHINMPLSDWLSIERKTFYGLSLYYSITNCQNLYINGVLVEGDFRIPPDIITVPPYALPGNRIASIIIPASVDSIGENAFYNSPKLTSIHFLRGTARTENELKIGTNAFNRCENLYEIDFDRTPTSIGSWAFHNTPWYNNQSDGMILIGNVFYDYKGSNAPDDGKLTIPEGIVCISSFGDDYDKQIISELHLPSSLVDIPKMHSFTNLESIYAGMHDPNDFIENDYYYYRGQSLLPSKFYNGEGTIYVAPEDLEKYKATKGWNGFWRFSGDEYTLLSEPTKIVAYSFSEIEDVNDSNGSVTINGNTVVLPKHSYIYDSYGRCVWQGKGNVSLSTGIYIIVTDGKSTKIMLR